jgi:glycosyltransferase involved in cell wall biosynthesis
MVFFVAPLAHVDRDKPTFLAAHKKIFLLIEILRSSGHEVVLINSGPAMGVKQGSRAGDVQLSDGSSIPYLLPSRYRWAKWGRLLNILSARKLIDDAVMRWGKPDLIWCYNGYGFEMRAARHAKLQYGSRILLEFEDWHFARSTVLNPKAAIDWILWRLVVSRIDYALVVNHWLARRLASQGVMSELLPGVLSDRVVSLPVEAPPFLTGRGASVRCGYFGGLTEEKGAGFVAELVELTALRSLPIHWIVTGLGPLSKEFRVLAGKYPDVLDFHESVPDPKLWQLMGSADVMLNPHERNRGVFPFKVLEAVASGRLVISTPLEIENGELDWLGQAVFCEPLASETWLQAIVGAREIFLSRRVEIRRASEVAAARYSRPALQIRLHDLLQRLNGRL